MWARCRNEVRQCSSAPLFVMSDSALFYQDDGLNQPLDGDRKPTWAGQLAVGRGHWSRLSRIGGADSRLPNTRCAIRGPLAEKFASLRQNPHRCHGRDSAVGTALLARFESRYGRRVTRRRRWAIQSLTPSMRGIREAQRSGCPSLCSCYGFIM